MLGNFGPPAQSIALTVATAHLIIQGTIETRLRRLTDVLNEPDASHLLVLGATFMEVGSRRVIAEAAVAQVQLAEVLFVHMNESIGSTSEMRIPKQAVRTTLLAPPFTIEGQIHLPYESELRLALDDYGGRFLPVTKARYWAYGVAESPCNVDLLVVNHAKTHVAISAGVDWRTEAPPDDGPGSSQNPW
jgi:hypothetical protein